MLAARLLASDFYMDKTLRNVVIGGVVVLSLCALYYFVFAPMTADKKLGDCLRYASPLAGMSKEDCFKRYGR